MKDSKAKMFNRKASGPESKPDQILETLALRPGQNVADIGAGGGYFSLRFADAVGRKGKVYAVDVNPGFLEFVKDSATKKGVNNVETILAAEDRVTLPKKTLNLIFVRNAYHHLPSRAEYFRNLKGLLKPGGRVAIVEYKRGGRFNFRRIFGHYVPKENIVKEMEEAGYRLKSDINLLLKQSFTIFSSEK